MLRDRDGVPEQVLESCHVEDDGISGMPFDPRREIAGDCE
jgi:hypothetical protein